MYSIITITIRVFGSLGEIFMKVRRFKYFMLVFLITLCFTALCGCFDIDEFIVDMGLDDEETEANETYTVMVRETAGVKVEEEDCIKEVTDGKSVTFKIKIEEGYIYLGNTADATYSEADGTLHVKKVDAPITIDVIVIEKSELYQVKVSKSVKESVITFATGSYGWMIEPEETSLIAQAPDGYSFSGWSVGGYLDKGGTFVSGDAEYTFTPHEKITHIYANFVDTAIYKIHYNINAADGTINKSGTATSLSTFTVEGKYNERHALQQVLNENSDKATFTRKGHYPIGYSTSAVGIYNNISSVKSIPGFVNMGGACEVPISEGSLDLYVVWAKETASNKFTTQNVSGGVSISAYNGNDETVVIPETINGKKVIKISSSAFKSTSIKKVVLPKSVKTIENNAFSQAVNIKELVFFDSVTTVSDSSFALDSQTQQHKIKTVVLNAQKLPAYSGGVEGSFCIKYYRVRSLHSQGKKKLIVVAGSNVLNGLNSPMLEKNMNYEYEVVNYGTNAGTQMVFYLNVIANYIDEGDIVVHAPEWDCYGPMGENQIQWKLFRANNQCYDIFREVDMREYKGFFDAWREFQIGAGNAAQTQQEYQKSPSMNKWGDRLEDRTSTSTKINGYDLTNINTLLVSNDPSRITEYQRAQRLNLANDRIKANGGTMVLSFGAALYDSVAMSVGDPSALPSKYDALTQNCANALNYPVISNVGTYVFDMDYMYDSKWHATFRGANARTQYLTDDLNRFFLLGGDTWLTYKQRELTKQSPNDYPLIF